MFISRSLLLKGLGGVGVIAGAGSLVVFREKIFGVGEEDLSGFNHRQLIEKVGLDCGLSEGVNELEDNTIKDCRVKNGGTINVEVEGKKEEGVSFTTGTQKLKVSKDKDYSGKLRFVVDSGDLDLTKDGGSATTIQKLEQFETYEVKKVGEKFYLKRKTEAKEGKKDALGLPSSCNLPGAGDSNCSLTTEEVKKVKFEKQESEQISLTSGTVNLKISMSGDTTTFTDGYRFTFTFPKDLTINGKTLKANTPYDFKIKKGTENKLTLERAWSEDKDFAKKAGLSCTNPNECTVPADPKLNVRVGDKKKEGITTTTGGKIKMETEKEGYYQGLKFSISGGDVTISNGTGEGISKLEELETYEITEEGGKFYLSIKTSKKDAIKSSLALPEGCFKTLNTACTLDAESFKNINFEGKSSPSATGTVNLTISEATNSTDFPLGYKFTFSTTADATITAGKNSKIIKANIPTDFKIKRKNNGISLEKAWTATTLGKKVGLTCNNGECTVPESGNTLRVKQVNKHSNSIKQTTLTKSSGNGKIKVTKDTQGYNQGFKFEISEGSINLTGSVGTDDNDKINSLGEYETYEIKEEGNDGWFLVRKDKADDFIKKGLNIGSICTGSFPETAGGAPETCNIEDPNKLKEINFENKSGFKTWPTTKNIQLEINKDTSLPGGFKFTFNSCSGSCSLPGSTNAKTDASGGLMYRIKKGKGTNLSLEPIPKNGR